MTRGASSVGVYAAVAVACSVAVALGIVLFLICKKKRVVEVDEEKTPMRRLFVHSIPWSDVDVATDGFNPRRIIGRGRLGTVYKAVSTSGDVFALKRIDAHLVLSNAGLSFSSRINSLSLAHHPNIVPVLAYSEAPAERVIITEFVGMKSLDFYLHQNMPDYTSPLLDWGIRLKIAAGAARGIEYLHEGIAPHVVHGCIRPSNILMDVNFCARVCDFGLSFMAPHDRRGLVGYLDGESLSERMGVCKASDVYGFGVVLLELLSGRRCEEGLVVEWALPLIRASRVREVLDPRLAVPLETKALLRLAKVASACVGNSRKSRPSIAHVAAILNNLEMQPFE